jgi:hypothetical protein
MRGAMSVLYLALGGCVRFVQFQTVSVLTFPPQRSHGCRSREPGLARHRTTYRVNRQNCQMTGWRPAATFKPGGALGVKGRVSATLCGCKVKWHRSQKQPFSLKIST